MKILIDTAQIKDAAKFGETLRFHFFVKTEGLGGYDTYELESALLISRLHPDNVGKYFGDKTEPYKTYIHAENPSIFVAWSNLTLVVGDGERTAINKNCKFPFDWKFI